MQKKHGVLLVLHIKSWYDGVVHVTNPLPSLPLVIFNRLSF